MAKERKPMTTKPRRNKAREERLAMEIVVDACSTRPIGNKNQR